MIVGVPLSEREGEGERARASRPLCWAACAVLGRAQAGASDRGRGRERAARLGRAREREESRPGLILFFFFKIMNSADVYLFH
jgi:hypothetical protein